MSTDTRTTTPTPTRSGLDGFFKISERGSTVAREVRGGVVTFFTMVYIVVLNPIILSGVVDGSGTMIGGTTDLTRSKLLVAVGTAVVAGVMSILMGLVANFPIALAAGLGINGLITGMVLTHSAEKITFADLMGLVVIEGVIILVLVLTGFRKAVFKAIPGPLKVAISVGIGLFIAYIGVIDAGFARRQDLWAAVPERLDGHGATVSVLAADLIASVEGVLEPLRARQADEVERLDEQAKAQGGRVRKKDLEDRHRREQRRARMDELRAGLAVLARSYRDRLATGARHAEGDRPGSK